MKLAFIHIPPASVFLVILALVLTHCKIKQEEDLVFPSVIIPPPPPKDTTFEFIAKYNGKEINLNGVVKDKTLLLYNDSLEMTIRIAKLDTGKIVMINTPQSAYAKMVKNQIEYTTRHNNASGFLHITQIDTASNTLSGTVDLKLVNSATEEVILLSEGELSELPVVHMCMYINGNKIKFTPIVSPGNSGIEISGNRGKLTIYINDQKKGVYSIDGTDNRISYTESDKTYKAISGEIVLTGYYSGKLAIGTFEFTGISDSDSPDQITAYGSFAYSP